MENDIFYINESVFILKSNLGNCILLSFVHLMVPEIARLFQLNVKNIHERCKIVCKKFVEICNLWINKYKMLHTRLGYRIVKSELQKR